MSPYKAYLYFFLCAINFALFSRTHEKNNLKNNFQDIKKNNFTETVIDSFKAPKNFIKRILDNNSLILRELADSTTTITIVINGTEENAKIISDDFTILPNHVFLNDNSEDLGSINTINLTQEGPNTITIVWDTKLKKSNLMFSGCSSIVSIDLSKMDASSITTMKEMFLSCSSLRDLNLTNFDTKGCKNMNNMFKGCTSLKFLDLSSFNTIQVTNMKEMFSGCSSLTYLDLSNFDTPALKYIDKMFLDCKKLTSLEISKFDTTSITNMNGLFTNCSSLVHLNLSNFDTSLVTNVNAMFRGCSSLEDIYFPKINTSSIKNMNDMFYGCSSLLNLDMVSKFDTSSVTTMNSMFKDCSSLTSLDVSNFNTNTVGNMEWMFFGCSSIKSLNLSNFYTPSLVSMQHLFNGCESLISLDISNFNTSLVKNMGYLFRNCFNIKSINLTNFDTTSVTTMLGMFYTCYSLESLDLSNFNTTYVKSMNDMFLNCKNLEFVNLTNFNMTIPTIKNMFMNCTSLKRVDLTNFICSNLNLIFTNMSAINIINRTDDLGDNQIFSSTIIFSTKTEKLTTEQIEENKYTTNKLSDNNPELKNTNPETTQEIKDIYSTQLIDIVKKIIEINEYNDTNIKEIINNLDEIILDKDPSNVYKISGIDYQIYIKPINTYIEDASVNIYLEECENILKENNPSKNFTILQVNLKNNNSKCLVDQVEYKVYDENKQEVDLSVCKDVNIKIEYKIQNTSLINIEQIKDFKNQGIDIFNIKDVFFNDICYPYTDNNSNSDMILSDRISDIFQNYSICGDGCEYDSFNIEKQVTNCNCKIKNEVDAEVKEGNFESSIESAFLDSNFGVIKCFNLVFGKEGKLKNSGFWIFAILTVLHIPAYIFLFINGINPVQSYISKEMSNKGYIVNNNSLGKEKEITIPKLESNKNMITMLKETIENDEINNSAPPKKKTIIRRLSKKNKTHLHTIIEDTDKEPNKNSYENENELEDYQNTKEVNDDIGKRPDRRKSMKTLKFKFKNISKTDLDTIINEPKVKKYKRIKKKSVSHINNIINTYDRMNEKENVETENKKDDNYNNNNINNFNKKDREFPLIQVNANNNEKNEIFHSNHKLNIYNYDEAILYEQRSYFRIFFIYLISKENLLNLIFFNPPLELKPLRFCIFIFNYTCDLALNALFYLSQNISDKYHYSGPNRIFFSLINNLTKSIASTIVGYILLFIFTSLSQSRDTIIKIFRTQDNLLKKDKTYKVDDETKIKISNEIEKILKCLKIKIICFVIFELLLSLFFFYYVTAFCHVYKSTQTSWLLDSLSSYIISFFITLILSLILAMLYKLSVNYKINILYKISLLVYS